MYWWAVQVINYFILDDLWYPGENFQRKNNFSVIKTISVRSEAMNKFEQYYESEFCDECGSQNHGDPSDCFLRPKACAERLGVSLSALKKLVRDGVLRLYASPWSTVKLYHWAEVKSALIWKG